MDRLLEATARAERDHFWFRGFRRVFEPLVADLAGGRDLDILDCGCGTGHNLSWLSRHGRATGIDLTWAGLQFARAAGMRRLARASAGELPFGDARFDLVTSFDVLYALPDAMEHAAIAEMFRVLRPGGRLVVNVAALESLRGNHSILSGEIRRYSRGSLRKKLEAAGFRVERLTYRNMAILPLVAGVRLAQRVTGHVESQEEIAVPTAPVNAVLSGVLAAEASLLRMIDLPLGSSLMAVAERPTVARSSPEGGRPAT